MTILTLQILLEGMWRDCAKLHFEQPELGRKGAVSLAYEQDYAIDHLGKRGIGACSVNMPVDLMQNYRSDHWFGFLDDIMPAGASRRYWVQRLGLGHTSELKQDFDLLRHGCIAPVGNLRIKEAVPNNVNEQVPPPLRFKKSDVVDRNNDFLEYAQEMGGAAGGATGAGGEAPKLLLRKTTADQIWIDTCQENNQNNDQYYLVKFPRGERKKIDCDILRAEYHYYHELSELGMESISTKNMHLEEGEHYPSLWLPRFDVGFTQNTPMRYGLESIYSILNAAPGSFLNHGDVLKALCNYLSEANQDGFSREKLTIEWLKRDLINIAFGNSDNHGRNTAILKMSECVKLAPVFDFAPMKADPEGITRSTKWPNNMELAGDYNWTAICESLSELCPSSTAIEALRTLATQILGLKHRLQERGVPESILAMPVMGFDYLDAKLTRWFDL